MYRRATSLVLLGIALFRDVAAYKIEIFDKALIGGAIYHQLTHNWAGCGGVARSKSAMVRDLSTQMFHLYGQTFPKDVQNRSLLTVGTLNGHLAFDAQKLARNSDAEPILKNNSKRHQAVHNGTAAESFNFFLEHELDPNHLSWLLELFGGRDRPSTPLGESALTCSAMRDILIYAYKTRIDLYKKNVQSSVQVSSGEMEKYVEEARNELDKVLERVTITTAASVLETFTFGERLLFMTTVANYIEDQFRTSLSHRTRSALIEGVNKNSEGVEILDMPSAISFSPFLIPTILYRVLAYLNEFLAATATEQSLDDKTADALRKDMLTLCHLAKAWEFRYGQETPKKIEIINKTFSSILEKEWTHGWTNDNFSEGIPNVADNQEYRPEQDEHIRPVFANRFITRLPGSRAHLNIFEDLSKHLSASSKTRPIAECSTFLTNYIHDNIYFFSATPGVMYVPVSRNVLALSGGQKRFFLFVHPGMSKILSGVEYNLSTNEAKEIKFAAKTLAKETYPVRPATASKIHIQVIAALSALADELRASGQGDDARAGTKLKGAPTPFYEAFKKSNLNLLDLAANCLSLFSVADGKSSPWSWYNDGTAMEVMATVVAVVSELAENFFVLRNEPLHRLSPAKVSEIVSAITQTVSQMGKNRSRVDPLASRTFEQLNERGSIASSRSVKAAKAFFGGASTKNSSMSTTHHHMFSNTCIFKCKNILCGAEDATFKNVCKLGREQKPQPEPQTSTHVEGTIPRDPISLVSRKHVPSEATDLLKSCFTGLFTVADYQVDVFFREVLVNRLGFEPYITPTTM
ncbi:hypothetical protein NEDG_00090 [Nematocida displodere]|uniref:Uncharacterized protein n=1 Tax=Nematocida displodere TaxID=1805483 RepID=A0A177EI16_9MICR|nr:hypothetical protein NEDG_00090 [Nematocida displodere]